jgi:hypothetical protein
MSEDCNRTINEALVNVSFSNPSLKVDKLLFNKNCLSLLADFVLLSSYSDQSKSIEEES